MSPLDKVSRCPCCGSESLVYSQVLWPELIAEWRLAPAEVMYIDRQQGFRCDDCGSNLRSMALAAAIMRGFGADSTFADFLTTPQTRQWRILEINEAGGLSSFLATHSGHTLAVYPDVDMADMPYPDESFDLVVHSDTLEHVNRPVQALAECRRVLRVGGLCAFTIPMIVGRLSASREGMPPSYHGAPDTRAGDWSVATEYGADAWRHVIEAGFPECRIYSLEYPAAQAFTAFR